MRIIFLSRKTKTTSPFNGEPLHDMVGYQSDRGYCCDEMEKAFNDNVINFGDGESSRGNVSCDVNILKFSYCTYNLYPIEYCPFCGEEVVCEELPQMKAADQGMEG